MPRTPTSIEKMSDEKLEEMLERLSLEKAKRELVSPDSEQVAAIGESIIALAGELGVDPHAIATAAVQSVLGVGYVVNKRRGRVPGTKVASRKKRAAKTRVAKKVSRKKKPA